MESIEPEKPKAHISVKIIEYAPHAVLGKTIVRTTTGNITVSAFYTTQELAEKTIPFATYIQIIDGAAQVFIDDKRYRFQLREVAHSKQCFSANVQFKMIATVIKSGYEE